LFVCIQDDLESAKKVPVPEGMETFDAWIMALKDARAGVIQSLK
jgi:hypothetical protein